MGPPQASGQLPKVDDQRLGVDLLQLTSGERVYGFALGADGEGQLRFASERTWLEATYPAIYQRAIELEQTAENEARERLNRRVEDWIKERTEDERLVRFLKYQLEKSQRPARHEPEPPRFVVLTIERNQIRKFSPAPAGQRQVAGLAYQHELPDVVQTPASLLRRKLEELGVDVATQTVDLSGQLPKMDSFTDQQWAAKIALVEYQMRKSLEYQGTAANLIRVGDQLNPQDLLGSLLRSGGVDAISQLGAELGLPEFQQLQDKNENWWQPAVEEAEHEGFRGVLVTRLNQALLGSTVEVETRFLARQGPGQWFTVYTTKVQADGQQQREADLQRLREDPQVQQVLQAVTALGLDATEQLERALRSGAATEQALAESKGAFNLFLGQHADRLDGPWLPLP